MQRYMERNIRKYKREFLTMEAAGQDTTSAAAKLKEWRSKERDFLRQTGLKRQNERMYVKASAKIDGEKDLWIYGETGVDTDLIASQEYRMAFRGITDNPEVDDRICFFSRKILTERNGTKSESLYILDMDTGKKLHEIHTSDNGSHIAYSKEDDDKIKSLVENGNKLITIHNHPSSYPPDADDGSSAMYRGYTKGVVVGHNGRVYTYSPTKRVYTKDELQSIHNSLVYQLSFCESIDEMWQSMLQLYGMNISYMR